jgi:hypothetical protein
MNTIRGESPRGESAGRGFGRNPRAGRIESPAWPARDGGREPRQEVAIERPRESVLKEGSREPFGWVKEQGALLYGGEKSIALKEMCDLNGPMATHQRPEEIYNHLTNQRPRRGAPALSHVVLARSQRV